MAKVGKDLDGIIDRAQAIGASAIHIEPRAGKFVIRERVDGVLQPDGELTADEFQEISRSLKSRAGLDVDETRQPQTGIWADDDWTLRISTLPTTEGEKVTVHMSATNVKAPSLVNLGFFGDNLEHVKAMLKLKRGLILLAGPDDTGKATTLFTFLTELNHDGVNISTIESEIDHRLPNANQTATSPTLSMADGLAAILKTDSEIIMASHIPDSRTAKLLIEAALSGRLVFSALNAESGGRAIAGLHHIGVESFLTASILRNIISTRLVRQLCNKCRESYSPTQRDLTLYEQVEPTELAGLEKQMMAAKLGVGGKSALDQNGRVKTLWRAKGCTACNQTGYLGRIGLYEILTNTHDIEQLIVGHAAANLIDREAERDGMITLMTDGLVKALRGITTIEEIVRVC